MGHFWHFCFLLLGVNAVILDQAKAGDYYDKKCICKKTLRGETTDKIENSLWTKYTMEEGGWFEDDKPVRNGTFTKNNAYRACGGECYDVDEEDEGRLNNNLGFMVCPFEDQELCGQRYGWAVVGQDAKE